MARLYAELRALAGAVFSRQGREHTLQPTAVVHEAWIKLLGKGDWKSREHFLSTAAMAMRQILQDHARKARTAKRGEAWQRVTLDEGGEAPAQRHIDLLVLDEVLTKLGKANERYLRVFELHYLAGLGTDEVAEQLGVSRRTVQLDWRAIRALIQKELAEEP